MDVIIPALGESVTEASIGQWLKKVGDAVAADEPIVSLETDKVAVEVNAPAAGVLTELLFKEGDTVTVGAAIARIDSGAKAGAGAGVAAKPTELPIKSEVPAAAHAPDGEAGEATGEGAKPTPDVVPAAANAAAAPTDQAPTTGPTARRKAEEGIPVPPPTVTPAQAGVQPPTPEWAPPAAKSASA